MAKKKCPFKRFPLRAPPPPSAYTPPPDVPEQTSLNRLQYFPGARYTSEELSFIKAVDSFRRRHGSKFLSAIDHLRIAIALGYRLADTAPPATSSPPRPVRSK